MARQANPSQAIQLASHRVVLWTPLNCHQPRQMVKLTTYLTGIVLISMFNICHTYIHTGIYAIAEAAEKARRHFVAAELEVKWQQKRLKSNISKVKRDNKSITIEVKK